MKKSFILHLDSLSILDEMTFEQKGILFDAIYKFQQGEEVNLDFGMKMAFAPFKNQFIRDNEKYSDFVEKQAENGKKGGRPPKDKPSNETQNNPNNPSLLYKTQKSLSVSDSANVNNSVSVSGNENESKKDLEKEISKEILPSVPVVSEIKKVINSSHGDGELHYLCRVYATENENKYPNDMYKEFLSYWTAIVTNGKLKKHNGKEKWRNEETFVMQLRLSTWFKNYIKDAKNNNTNFGASKGLGATAVFSADKDYSRKP